MFLWLALISSLLVLLGLLSQVPLKLTSSVQGNAEPSGAWAVACGVGVGPLALSAIGARGVAPFLTCHVFGKQLAQIPLSRWQRREKPRASAPASAPESEAHAPLTRIEVALSRLFRSLDPLEALLSWWQTERIFRIESLIVEVGYSFQDVALTGRILAALYVLSGVLPASCEIRQTPGWESEDRAALAADGTFKLWPGRLLLWAVRFVLKQRSEARQSARLAKRATEPS
ncbi:MAG TPA: hypothetical protein VGM44_17795 [Polyangiaceae bacterium]|jgi:hypothetical protein